VATALSFRHFGLTPPSGVNDLFNAE